MARAGALLITNPFHRSPGPPAGLRAQAVRFRASDGVSLSGWLALAGRSAPTVVLIAGSKASSRSMVPYARMLHAGGFNALLYDSRGTGGSGGSFTLGVREVDDVRGAVAYLNGRRGLRDRRYGLLGVSLGAGVAIVAAAGIPWVAATVADSAFTDQRRTVDRLDVLHFGSVTVPLAPLAPWTVDRLTCAPLGSFSPLRAVRHIAPRALLLIHSRDDTNPTTPLSGALALKRAAGSPASLWIAPRGGHAGAFAAQPAEYARRVLAFFRRYLR